MLRSLPRATPRASAFAPRTRFVRQASVSAHAISNPTLAGIEKRWEAMQPQEQAELWMALRDRMKVDWTQLTLQEKKAGRCLRVLFFERLGGGGWREGVVRWGGRLVGLGGGGLGVLRCFNAFAGG